MSNGERGRMEWIGVGVGVSASGRRGVARLFRVCCGFGGRAREGDGVGGGRKDGSTERRGEERRVEVMGIFCLGIDLILDWIAIY